ncbi:hypothetical protein RMN64_15485 [Plesiomonas shigelloides]|uniref:hypothetical protein n=1 Tax=Plesiomonas shigelloides TaxID=703 RepID=UPI002886D3DB|nr:hypothetical protein [Plesiomonas shigelloides]MDT1012817.1 hypothetical protein [Plesiomonas shigelloides]
MWSKIQIWALKKAFKKVGPTRIPMSSPECEKNNFYSTRIKLDGVSALVRELNENTVKVLKYNSETNTCDINLDINIINIDANTIEITYYLHNYHTTYTGINSFIFHCLSRKDYLKFKSMRALNKVSQFLFNRKKLQLKPRYDLLDYLIENYGVCNKEFSLISLTSDIYSLRFFWHPDRENCQNKIRMYIDSFVESGEISKIERMQYKVNGKAIVTLEKYQTEERRHKDSVKLQYSMVILTLILAILASIQAGLIKLKPFLDLSQ